MVLLMIENFQSESTFNGRHKATLTRGKVEKARKLFLICFSGSVFGMRLWILPKFTSYAKATLNLNLTGGLFQCVWLSA
jgi:hypothetical protein